jgi:hypothetical protein
MNRSPCHGRLQCPTGGRYHGPLCVAFRQVESTIAAGKQEIEIELRGTLSEQQIDC